MRSAIVIAVLLGGCRFDLPAGASDGTCTTSRDDCVCLNPPGICVECTIDDTRNCSVAEPACESDNQCRGCVSNEECGTGACIEDGTCASPNQVIYAAPNGLDAPGGGTMMGLKIARSRRR